MGRARWLAGFALVAILAGCGASAVIKSTTAAGSIDSRYRPIASSIVLHPSGRSAPEETDNGVVGFSRSAASCKRVRHKLICLRASASWSRNAP